MNETGLPEVGEGYRWRIAPLLMPNRFSMAYNYHPTKLTIHLEELSPLKAKDVSFENEPVTPEDKEVVEYVKKKSLFGRERIVQVRFRSWDKVDSEPLKGNHAIAASNAANRIMKRRAADKVRQSLIGVYPPKKLEG